MRVKAHPGRPRHPSPRPGQVAITLGGGAALASRLLREPRDEDLAAFHARQQRESGAPGSQLAAGAASATEGAAGAPPPEDPHEAIAAALAAGRASVAVADPELPPGWRRTAPLHLLLNLAAAERAQPRVCSASLDDLVRATLAPPRSHPQVCGAAAAYPTTRLSHLLFCLFL